MTRINGLACALLVALRLTIGWHFLVEGAYKIHTHRVGKTSTNMPWTGEPFFREGYGPAAPLARDLLGMGDKTALARLTVVGNQFPPALAVEWQTFADRFAAHYSLSADQKQRAADALSEVKSRTLAWLRGDSPAGVSRVVPWGTVDLKLTVPQRLSEYRVKSEQVAEAYGSVLPAFDKDVEKIRLRTLKAEAAKLLADLNSDLQARAAEMKSALASVLTPGQAAKGPMPDEEQIRPVQRLDVATMWAHAVLGACLLVGMFTRVASLLLALFLLGVTLIAPAVPFAPAAPGAVGHYLYVNLYTIEMVALLGLSAMPTGRWFGLDALVHVLTNRRRVEPPLPETVYQMNAGRP